MESGVITRGIEDIPFSRTVMDVGNYPVVLILNEGNSNPADVLKQPPAPCDRPLAQGMSDLPVWFGACEAVKESAFDLIFPFHYFL